MSPGSAMWRESTVPLRSVKDRQMASRRGVRYDPTRPTLRSGRAVCLAEFLAIHQSDASLLGCLLRRLAGRVSLGDSERAAGVGFFQSDDLLLRKRPVGGQAALPEKLADGVESEATLICSGAVGTSGRAFNEQLTLPSGSKRWLFAIAGQPDALAPIRAVLLKALPDYLRRSVKGDSAAEGLFFTFLSRLRDVRRLDDHELGAEAAARSLAAAVGEAERAFEQVGQPLPGMAAVGSNGRVMAGLRRGHPVRGGGSDGVIPRAGGRGGPSGDGADPKGETHR